LKFSERFFWEDIDMHNSLAGLFTRGKAKILTNFTQHTRKLHGIISSRQILALSFSSVTQERNKQNFQRILKAGASLSKAYHNTSAFLNPFAEEVTDRDRILAVNGNITCSDCSSGDVHYVSSLNGGVYCPVCAGIHREIGIHPDFIVLKTDIEVSDEDMQFYESMGNHYVNNIYEASLDVVGANKPTVSSTRSEMSDFIREKYLKCSYSVSRHDRSATENVLHYVSNMKARGRDVPSLREKVIERAGATYAEIMDEAFESPYVLQVAE